MPNTEMPRTINDIPSHLNGYPVLWASIHRDSVTVMLEDIEREDRYVVATWAPSLQTQWICGHYYNDWRLAVDMYRLLIAERGIAGA